MKRTRGQSQHEVDNNNGYHLRVATNGDDNNNDNDNDNDNDNNNNDNNNQSQDLESNGNEEENGENGDEYKVGSIVRVKMENFVTYEFVEFRPGPRLNLVLGPNGTGKSSISCAIALALGVSPKLLDRAKDPKDFIKRGSDDACIEIELFRGNPKSHRNLVISRSIFKQKTDKWQIDGKSAKKEQIHQLAKDLNIQIDNLCQFLPQERVVEFAKLSPQLLLKETEKAVGGEALLDIHQKLTEIKKSLLEGGKSLEQRRKVLEDLKKRNESFKAEVERFKKREQLDEQLGRLKEKRPWLEYQEEDKRCQEFKEKKEQAEQNVAKAKKEIEPLTKQKQDFVDKVNANVQKSSNEKGLLRKLDTEREEHKKKLEDLEEQVETEKSQFIQLRNRAADRKKKEAELKHSLETLEEEYKKMPTLEVLQEENHLIYVEFSKLQDEMKKLDVEKAKLEDLRKTLQHQREEIRAALSELKNTQKQKETNLSLRWRDTYVAFRWIKEHSNKFEKKVFGPLCLEMSVEQPMHGAYLEQCLGITLSAFVVLSPYDRDIIYEECCKKQNLKVLILYTPQLDQQVHKHPCPLSSLQQFGITHFLDEVFESDPIVKKTLCNYNIHSIGAGTPNTEKISDKVWEQTELREFYTPFAQHRKGQSLYGKKNISVTRIPLRTPTNPVLSTLVDPDQEVKLLEDEKTIDQKMNELRDRGQDVAKREAELKEKIREVEKKKENNVKSKSRLGLMIKKIEQQKNLIASLNVEENIEEQEQKIKDTIHEINDARLKAVHELFGSVQAHVRTALDSDTTLAQKIEASYRLSQAEQRLQQKSGNVKSAEAEYNEAVETFNRAQKRLKEFYNRAKQILDISTLTKEQKSAFNQLPNTIEELDDEIEVKNAQAKAIFLTNPKVIEEYEQRKIEIANLEKTLGEAEENQLESNAKIEALKEEWLPALEEFTAKINDSFSKYMRDIQCEGEIKLDKKDDFAEWGMQIFVKFRKNEQITLLNSHVQSGGERSVATMLYLLSLQSLTTSPFRLVDEINQGMDPTNEKMIFGQIVKSAKGRGPQYFLITPKLLQNLDYSDDVRVLCILNAPWLPKGWSGLME